MKKKYIFVHVASDNLSIFIILKEERGENVTHKIRKNHDPNDLAQLHRTKKSAM